MSKDDLIFWEQEPAVPADSWGDLLTENKITEDDMWKHNIAAIAEERNRIAAENEIAEMSDKQLREQWERAVAEQERATLPARQVDAVHRFIQATPELMLTPRNQRKIDKYLTAAGLDASDPSHFDAAYKALSARKLLDIDESKRLRTPYQRHTPADLESMPLEQLEELARGQR